MINKILKLWVEDHPWLKLATIENDLELPKRFLTSEMQDTKALVKACHALQSYGFQIAPGIALGQPYELEGELTLEFVIEDSKKQAPYKTFIRDVERHLVKQINK